MVETLNVLATIFRRRGNQSSNKVQMEIDFNELMTKKSEEELMDYITRIDRYTPESIMAAVNELKKRGRNFTDEELNDLKAKIQAKIENGKKSEAWTANSWKKNIVTDLEAPLLYSQRAIWGFSIFFTVIFGAVLLSSNLTEKKAKWIVIGFGIIYTTIAAVILSQLPPSSGLTIGINAGGGVILTSIFWNKYVGQDTKFRAKPIWKPLIISLIITIPLLLAIIYGPPL